MPLFCGSCGVALADRAAFCLACGTPVEPGESASLAKPSSESRYSIVGEQVNPTQDEPSVVRVQPPLKREGSIFRGATKKILLPAIGLTLFWHVMVALSMGNHRCLDDLLPAPSCRTPASLWVNPLTDAATLTAPSSAAFGVENKDIAAGFRMGFDFVASNLIEKKLNDGARKYFDLYAMLLPYRVMVEEKEASERPLPFSLNVTGVSSVQTDPQGHVMLFTQAHSKDGKNFVLVCHSARSTCSRLQTGVDFTFTVLQQGDANYAYDYTEQEGAVVVGTSGVQNGVEHNIVFTMVKRQTTPDQEHFRYTEYPHGFQVDEICSEPTISPPERYCYPSGWQTWLKELERRTAGNDADALAADTGVQTPGNLAMSWDSEQRVVFSGCRPHDCPSAHAYFIVAPGKHEVDIIWQSEKGITYLGPNAALLRANNAYEWLESVGSQ